MLTVDPFPLRLELCENGCDLITYARDELKRFGGIRFTNKIPEYLVANLPLLTGDGWTSCVAHLDALRRDQSLAAERSAADFLDDTLWGFGPKQSRNLLQILGLTKQEIPLDSRVVKWMRSFGFSLPLSANLLQDREYYCFIEDAVQSLCRAAGVFPCVLDAAVFASFDGEGWTAENAVW